MNTALDGSAAATYRRSGLFPDVRGSQRRLRRESSPSLEKAASARSRASHGRRSCFIRLKEERLKKKNLRVLQRFSHGLVRVESLMKKRMQRWRKLNAFQKLWRSRIISLRKVKMSHAPEHIARNATLLLIDTFLSIIYIIPVYFEESIFKQSYIYFLNMQSEDLAGVMILHGLDKVIDGGAVVLTLKDQYILADGDINEEAERDKAYMAAKKKTGTYDNKE